MKPKRLLIVTTTHETQKAFLFPFAKHFRDRGWQVDGLAEGISGCPECRKTFDRTWDIDWSRNPLEPQNMVRAPRVVREIAASRDYDLVHVHTPVAAFVTRFALRGHKNRPRVVYTAHGFHFYRGGNPLKNKIFLTLEKMAGRWTDFLVVMNGEDREAAENHRLVPPGKVRYMPGIGVDTESYCGRAVSDRDLERVRQEMKLGDDSTLFLMIAEFIPRKRHQDVLHAFARLGRPEAHLALAGDGPLEPTMQQLARTLGIQDRVHFLGFRRDIPTLIRASSAVLLSSRQEGLPRSIMEALCLEVPCIGSDIRGTRDLLADGCGILVPVGDVEGWARAMARIIDDPAEAKAMGRQGRIRMNDYDLRHIVRMHEELYQEACGQ